MILRVENEAREAQAIGIMTNLRWKIGTGKMPYSSGQTLRGMEQTSNIRHVVVVGKSLMAPRQLVRGLHRQKSLQYVDISLPQLYSQVTTSSRYRELLLVVSSV